MWRNASLMGSASLLFLGDVGEKYENSSQCSMKRCFIDTWQKLIRYLMVEMNKYRGRGIELEELHMDRKGRNEK